MRGGFFWWLHGVVGMEMGFRILNFRQLSDRTEWNRSDGRSTLPGWGTGILVPEQFNALAQTIQPVTSPQKLNASEFPPQ